MSDRPDVLQGLLYAHTRANLNTIEAHEARSSVEAVIALLVERGLLDASELEVKRDEVRAALRSEFVEKGMSVAIQDGTESKYAFEGGAEIDCASRVHLCHAACCRLQFALSKEDVEEGVVRWELGRPYMIAQTPTRRCVHLGSHHGCTVYENRPLTCRTYDCRNDERVWLDFEGRVPNPRVADADWPSNEPTRAETPV